MGGERRGEGRGGGRGEKVGGDGRGEKMGGERRWEEMGGDGRGEKVGGDGRRWEGTGCMYEQSMSLASLKEDVMKRSMDQQSSAFTKTCYE